VPVADARRGRAATLAAPVDRSQIRPTRLDVRGWRKRSRSIPAGTRGIPWQFVQMIRYVFTAIALAGVVRRSTPPAALGRAE